MKNESIDLEQKKLRDEKKKKSGKISLVIGAILVIIGLAVFLYPNISNYLAEQGFTEVIREYEETVSYLDEETVAEELEKAQTYNENLSGEPVHDPFLEESGYALPDNYEDVLNIASDGVMAYIEIPSISVYLPIYHGTDEETLTKGVRAYCTKLFTNRGKFNTCNINRAHRAYYCRVIYKN